MLAAQRGIGRTFQNNALFHRMSVIDNVLTGLTRLGRSTFLEIALRVGRHGAERRSFRKKAEEILDFLKIASYRGTVVWQPASRTPEAGRIRAPPWVRQNFFCSMSQWRE
jgi:branched-chain amino acid transport system ATP-binding protein